MPKTGLGAPELAPNGNSGNPATTNKLSNASAGAVRRVPSSGSDPVETTIETNEVQVSNTTVGEVPGSPREGEILDPSDFSIYDRHRRYREFGEPAQDEPATLAVQANFGDREQLVKGFSNFFLQSVSESEQEKMQVVETFSAYYAFFFGKRPPMYNFSGLLINDPTSNWMNTFRFMYENYFRGTASANLNAQAILTYDKRVVSGYLVGLSIQQDAASDKGVPFTFSMLVISHDYTDFSADFNDFMEAQQQRLAALRARAANDLRALNRNVDSLQNITKQRVLTGNDAPVTAKVAGEKKEERPDSSANIGNRAQSDTDRANLKQKPVQGS